MNELAFIALGSNLGDSRSLIQRATERLQAFSSGPLLRSSLWRSTPVDCPPGSPDFINAVVGLVPTVAQPEELLVSLQQIEREFGRRPKTVYNESRPIDLDLITWGKKVHATTDLVLPHPRAHLRRFVLAPLAEIAPDLVLPGQKNSVRELLATLRTDEKIERIR